MVGIADCGVYLPYYFIKGETVSAEWDRAPVKFTKRFASYDEDSLTMAVEAALACDGDGASPDMLVFATTTSPFAEKQGASVIAAALDRPAAIRTLDVCGSLRSATAALLVARDALRSGGASRVLVTSADCRPVEPGAPDEIAFGDAGAAAVLTAGDDLLAKIVDACSVSSEMLHAWRRDADEFIKSGDVRFSQQFGYERTLIGVMETLLKKTGVEPSQVGKVILPLPEIRPIMNVLKATGFDAKAQWHDPLTGFTGFSGAPHPLLLLASALENAQPGELILLCGYGDGGDAVLLEATERVGELSRRRPVKAALARRREILSYVKYLDFRNRLHRWDAHLESAFTSTILIARESPQNMRLRARKCRSCGAVLTLPLPVCPHCRAQEDFDEFKLSRRGRIYTFSQEYYVPTPDAPVSLCSIDLDGGGRFLTQMTDCAADEVEIGMEVELTFRRMHQAGGFHHYWWKARPVRGGTRG